MIWCSLVAKDVNSQPSAMTKPPRKAARRGDLWRQKYMVTGEMSMQVERQEETTSAVHSNIIRKMFKNHIFTCLYKICLIPNPGIDT